jgi:hypothetical protein
MLELLTALLSKTYNMDEAAVKELLLKKSEGGDFTDEIADSALDNLLSMDAERVKKLKPDTKSIQENFYKKGKQEALSDLEKSLRSEFGHDGEEQGLDLVRSIVGKKAGKPLDDDKVKTHPLYLQLEKQSRAEAEKIKAEYEAKIGEVEKTWHRTQITGKVKSKAMEVLDSLKPVLGENPAVAATRREDFQRLFDALEFEDANGEIVVLRDGKRIENAHGHAISFDQFVKDEAAKRFDFYKQDPKGNAGNQNGTKPATTTFKTEAEYLKAYAESNDPAAKTAMYEAWKAQSDSN